jgi:hypothetical protein
MMDGLQRLLGFADYLRSQRMPFVLQQQRDDALTLGFSTFGNRFLIDFFVEGMSCRRYRGAEDVFHQLAPVLAAIKAAASGSEEAVRDGGPEGASASEGDGLRRLLDFTNRLRRAAIPYTIEQQICDALEVGFALGGRRIEVEFSVREACYSIFEQEEIVFDGEAIRREVEHFERPFAPASPVADWRNWMPRPQDRAR